MDSSCFEVVQSSLRSLGTSSAVRKLVADSVLSSSSTCHCTSWRRQHHVDCSNPSWVQLAHFVKAFFFLFFVSSMRCHREAGCTTIRQLGGQSFSADSLRRDVTKAMASVIMISILLSRFPWFLQTFDVEDCLSCVSCVRAPRQ